MDPCFMSKSCDRGVSLFRQIAVTIVDQDSTASSIQRLQQISARFIVGFGKTATRHSRRNFEDRGAAGEATDTRQKSSKFHAAMLEFELLGNEGNIISSDSWSNKKTQNQVKKAPRTSLSAQQSEQRSI